MRDEILLASFQLVIKEIGCCFRAAGGDAGFLDGPEDVFV